MKENSRSGVVFRSDGTVQEKDNSSQESGDFDIGLSALLFKGGVVTEKEENKLPSDTIPSLHTTGDE